MIGLLRITDLELWRNTERRIESRQASEANRAFCCQHDRAKTLQQSGNDESSSDLTRHMNMAYTPAIASQRFAVNDRVSWFRSSFLFVFFIERQYIQN